MSTERDELQALEQQAAAEMAAVQAPVSEGAAAQAGLKAEAERLAGQLAEVSGQLEAEQSARSAAEREAKDKGDRLERMEGARVMPARRWLRAAVSRCWLLLPAAERGQRSLPRLACWQLAGGLPRRSHRRARPPAAPARAGPAPSRRSYARAPPPPLPQASWRRCRSAPSAWARVTRRRCSRACCPRSPPWRARWRRPRRAAASCTTSWWS